MTDAERAKRLAEKCVFALAPGLPTAHQLMQLIHKIHDICEAALTAVRQEATHAERKRCERIAEVYERAEVQPQFKFIPREIAKRIRGATP